MAPQQHESDISSSASSTLAWETNHELPMADGHSDSESAPPPQTHSTPLQHKTTTTTTVAESDVETGSDTSSASAFIDYIPPPTCSLPPPAKYKLWLVVLFLVYFAEWFASAANTVEALARSGFLNYHAALFILLCIIVFVLTFAALDLMVSCLTIKVRDEEYGLGPWLKTPRMAARLSQHDNLVTEIAACIVSIFEDGFEMFDPPAASGKLQGPRLYEYEKEGNVVLKIEHRIKSDKWTEYHAWQKKIVKLANSQPGLLDVHLCEPDGDLQVAILTFSSINRLNEYMTSPARGALIKKLEPLLQAPDTVQLQKNRDLPDAFTDLLTRQGECVPQLLPKKWKVWWLTTVGLFFVLLIRENVLEYYMDRWGLTSERLRGLVRSIFTTFFNSYIMTPFLIMIFSNWVQRKPSENDEKEPWRTLNDGFRRTWIKVIVFLAFYGGCAIAWAVNGR